MSCTDESALNRSHLTALLRFASPALPIGGFSYSQGIEAAVAHGLIRDAAAAQQWIGDNLQHAFAACELPLWVMQYRNWLDCDFDALEQRNEWFLASRETRELRMETEQMGWSFAQLMLDTEHADESERRMLAALKPVALPTAFAWMAAVRRIPVEPGLVAYCFGWLESQVSAAVKAAPLGQVAAQRILAALSPMVAEAVDEAMERAAATPPRLATLSPQLAILSARHETQYSRLFRS